MESNDVVNYLQEINAQLSNYRATLTWTVINVKESRKIGPFVTSVKVSKGNLYILYALTL